MTALNAYAPGQFCWVDINARDQVKAEAFYRKVFAWSVEKAEAPGQPGRHYTMFLNEGRAVAGCGQMSDEMIAAGVPSLWNSYVNVESCDAVLARTSKLGGSLMVPAMDVMDAGRLAFITDPGGASLGLWQKGNHIGSGVVNEPVSLSWNELRTDDVEKAKGFYGELFGWTFKESPNDDGPGVYVEIINAGRPNGGIMAKSAQMKDVPSHWGVYFAVADCDAMVEAVNAAGGTTLMPPMDVPEVGRFSVLADDNGATFTVIKLSHPQ
jgi:hypothetical protein